MPPDASTATAEKPKQKGKPEGSSPKQNSGYSQTYLPDVHRTLPHSLEAEQGLLGSMLLSPKEVIGECLELIGGDDRGASHFHIPAHATIYSVLVDLWNKQQPIDFITLTQVLQDRRLLEQVGGPAFVTNLFTYVPTHANAGYYLEIVREKFTLRQIISACTNCVSRAYDDQEQVQDLLDEVEQKVFAITQSSTNSKLPTIKEQVMEAVESIEKLYERKGTISGLSTGFSELDQMTDGLHEAEMIVIAARPSMGKTALAMNIAEHVALEQNKAVAVFSLEMSSQQLVQRLICSQARISLKKIKEGFLAERDFPKLTGAASRFAASRMIIDDTPGLSILELRAKCRRLKSQQRHQSDRHRLPATPPIHVAAREGQPPVGNRRNLLRHQSPRERTLHPDRCAGPAQPKSGKPHRRQQGSSASERFA